MTVYGLILLSTVFMGIVGALKEIAKALNNIANKM